MKEFSSNKSDKQRCRVIRSEDSWYDIVKHASKTKISLRIWRYLFNEKNTMQ